VTSTRMPLSELGHPSEHERHGIGSVGLHRSTFSLSSRTQGSSWLLAFSRRRLDRGHNCEPDATVSLGLAFSLRVSHLGVPSTSVQSEDRNAAEDPLMRFLGPFSTSSREDSPTRDSRPAEVRLRRWFDLDGLPPSRPCRLVSSGGTHGVPDCCHPGNGPEGPNRRGHQPAPP